MEDGGVDLGIEGIEDAELIGTGGAARVYRARQPRLNRMVAVKILDRSASDPATSRRFEREAGALGSLTGHRGIVTVFDVGTTSHDQSYLIMQLCSGGSLGERLERDGTATPTDACRIVATVADTLADAHDQGIIHRDIKPDNILVDDDGEHLVSDFGIAALSTSAGGVSTAMTLTPAYAPPETLAGQPPSPAGDVYSLGATLYSLVTGRTPFTDTEDGTEPNLLAVIARIASDPLDDTRLLGVPDPVAALIEATTAKDPETRPTMRDLATRAAALREQLATAPEDPIAAAPTQPDPTTTPEDPIAAAPAEPDPTTTPEDPIAAAPAEPTPPAHDVTIVVEPSSIDEGEHEPDTAPQPEPAPLLEPARTEAAPAGTRETSGHSKLPWAAAAAALAVIAVILGVVAANGGDDADSRSRSFVDVGPAPDTPFATESHVWVPNTADGTVSVVDIATRDVIATVATGGGPRTGVSTRGLVWVPHLGSDLVVLDADDPLDVVDLIDVGRGADTPVVANEQVWVPARDDGTLVAVDIASREVVDTIAVGDEPEPPIATEGFVWVADNGPLTDDSDDSLIVIDAATRRIVASIVVGNKPLTPVATSEHVWVSNNADATVSVIDIATLEVVETIAVGEGPQPPVAANGHVWVSNFAADTVSVIDIATREVVDTIAVGGGPDTPVVTDEGIWVAHQRSDTLTLIDVDSRRLVETVDVGDTPLTPLGTDGRLWVPNFGEATVSVVGVLDGPDAGSDESASTVSGGPVQTTTVDESIAAPASPGQVNHTITVGQRPRVPLIAGDHVWVANRDSDTVTVIDLGSRERVAEISVGESPVAPAATADHVWVTNNQDSSVTVIDIASREVVDTVTVGGRPQRPLPTPSGHMWVSNNTTGTVSVIDVETRLVVDTVHVGTFPTVPAATDRHVWVANSGDGTVSVIDVDTREVIDTVAVGDTPGEPVVTVAHVWVTNLLDNTVSVIDVATRQVVDTVAVGDLPGKPLATDVSIWAPNGIDETVTVIDVATREVIDTVAVGDNPRTPVAAGGAIWVPNENDGTISVIDPTTREVLDTIAVGAGPLTPAVNADQLWVPNDADGTVSVIDLAGGNTRSAVVTEGPTRVVPGILHGRPGIADGELWLPVHDPARLETFDPETLGPIDTVEGARSYTVPVEAGGLLWTHAEFDVLGLDPVSHEPVVTVEGAGLATMRTDIVVAGGEIFVPTQNGQLNVIDPDTRALVDTIDTDIFQIQKAVLTDGRILMFGAEERLIVVEPAERTFTEVAFTNTIVDVAPVGAEIWVATFDALHVLDADSLGEVETFEASVSDIAVTGEVVWLSNGDAIEARDATTRIVQRRYDPEGAVHSVGSNGRVLAYRLGAPLTGDGGPELLVIDGATLEELGRFATGANLEPPLVTDDRIYAIDGDGLLSVYTIEQ